MVARLVARTRETRNGRDRHTDRRGGCRPKAGLARFRDKGGLWTRYDLTEVATPEGFARNPRLVHDFYNARRANALDSSPERGPTRRWRN